MICTQCGRMVQDGSRFCINCGASITQQSTPLYTYGVPPQYTTLPKKKKAWPWILGVSLGAIVIVGILIAVAFGMMMRSLIKDSSVTRAAVNYTHAIAAADGSDFAYSIPDEYWDYLDSAYDVSRETMEDYLTFYLYGQDLDDKMHSSYAWISDYTYFDTDEVGKIEKQAAEEVLVKFGISASDYKELCSDNNASLIMVEIGDDWYPLQAMELTDELCRLAYSEDSEFSSAIAEYWDSFYVQKNPELESKVPLPFWNYLSQKRQTDMFSVDEPVQEYLNWLEGVYDVGEIQDIYYSYDLDDIEWYSDGEYYDLDDFDLTLTCWADIPMEIQIIGSEGRTYDETYLTMVQYDDKWYVYDYMYFCDLACSGEYSRQDDFYNDGFGMFDEGNDNNIV